MATGLVGQHQITTFVSPVNGTSPIDANTVRGNDNTIKTAYDAHDNDTTIHVQSSTLVARPTASTDGQKWMTSDGYRIYYDDGTAWHEAAYLPTAGGTVAGNVVITGTLGVDGNFSVNTTKFTVAASSGNTVIAGTLGVTGAVTLSTALADSNLATISTAGKVAAAAVAAGTFGSGAFMFGGAVSGITTLTTSSTINSQTISAAANLTGSLTIATGLTVSAGTAAVQAITGTTLTLSSTASLQAVTAAGTITAALGIQVTGSAGVINGAISKRASEGLLIAGITGATNDYTLVSPGAATIMSVPTGTVNVVFGGTITLPLGAGTGLVSIGAVDSGGAGFRVLRVPN